MDHEPKENNTKKFLRPLFLLSTVMLFFGLLMLILQNVSSNDIIDMDQKISEANILVFSSPTCPHCRNVEQYIADNMLEDKLKTVSLNATVPKYAALHTSYCQKDSIALENCGIPLMYDKESDAVVLGDVPIIDYLEDLVKTENQTDDTSQATIVPDDSNSNTKTNTLTWSMVIIGAIVDSFNPCAWSAMIFLITALLSMRASQKKLVIIGITYIVVIFCCYLLIGLGLMRILELFPSWTNYLYTGLGVIILIAAILELKDVFWYGKGPSLRIPEGSWPTLKKFMNKSTVPATIVVALLISILEFGCTGGIYTPIIALLAESSALSKTKAMFFLLTYNFIFIIPLIVILGLVLNGYSYKKLEKLRMKNRKLMRLLTGVVMVVLAVFMFLK